MVHQASCRITRDTRSLLPIAINDPSDGTRAFASQKTERMRSFHPACHRSLGVRTPENASTQAADIPSECGTQQLRLGRDLQVRRYRSTTFA